MKASRHRIHRRERRRTGRAPAQTSAGKAAQIVAPVACPWRVSAGEPIQPVAGLSLVVLEAGCQTISLRAIILGVTFCFRREAGYASQDQAVRPLREP